MDLEDIEDLYELTPMQQGMLFHTLYAPHSGVYLEQIVCKLDGQLDAELLSEAWQQVVLRHPPLRTAFLWEDMEAPLQVVYRNVQLPWTQHDWCGLPQEEQYQRLEALLTADRERGFELLQAPLLRFHLVQFSLTTCYLIWTHHHLLLDGWSFAIVLNEALVTYNALCQGREPELVARRPFREYVTWLHRQRLSDAEAFWRHYLQDFRAPTPLPLTRVKTEPFAEKENTRDWQEGENAAQLDEQGEHPAWEDMLQQRVLQGGRPVHLRGFTLDSDAAAALHRFARRYQLTLNTIIQGAWALLLSLYSGERDVVFGAVVAGRPIDLVGSEKMVGNFINTLPVRVRVAPQAELASWLTQLQEQQADARQYDYTPLVQIQGWSEVPRDLSLFESLIVFENYPIDTDKRTDEAHDGEIRLTGLQTLEQTNYPLVVIGQETPDGGVRIRLGYETARFAPESIERLLRHLTKILAQYAQSRVGAITLVDEQEQQLLSAWNTPQRRSSLSGSVAAAFREQALHNWDRIAVVCHDAHLSYGALEQYANHVAHHLRCLGVGSEVVVGVCLPRSAGMAIALLGVLKAGGVYLPLDARYPEERLTWMLADAAVAVVLTDAHSRHLFSKQTAARVVCLEDMIERAINEPACEPPTVESHPAGAAYMIYTSGSTGQPKGVVIPQQALLNHLVAISTAYALQQEDRLLQFASLNFDVSLEELLPSWINGASVVVWPEQVAPSPAELSRFINRERLSVLNLPSSYWHQWVLELARTPLPPDLRLVVIGSEKAQAARLALWQASAGERVELYNAYGLTETTITSLLYRSSLQSTTHQQTHLVPVGRPITNIAAYILDETLQPVAIGLPGELYLGGVGLARGYAGNPALTAERFGPHPFARTPGERLYRTGDRARYLPNGEIELLGRLDSQLKIRGFRIEPAEVESCLLQHPAVSEAIVVASEDTSGEATLVAYIVVNQQSPLLVGRVRNYLAQTLPPHMVPGVILPLKSFPLTSSGKVDLRALPAPAQRLTEAESYHAPRTQVEEVLARIWSEVLHLERVGRSDHFFKLGGHSLQATQVVARLRETLQLELPVRAIYDAPTVVALATKIEQIWRGGSQDVMPPIIQAAPASCYPLSFAQQRIWFFDHFQPGVPCYHIAHMLSLLGALSVQTLERSLQALVQRHDALRTIFTLINGQPMQMVNPTLDLPLPVIQLAEETSLVMQEGAVMELSRAEARRPFDLERGPLLRVSLVRLNPEEHLLLLTLHHIIADGWSAEIFLQELSALYAAQRIGQPLTLPPLPIRYVDYALWQRNWLQGAVLERQLAYWRTQLAGAPALLDLPVDHPRPAVQSFRGALYPFTFPLELMQQLQVLSREEGVTLFMTLLAAVQTLLYRYTQQSDIVVGTPTSGRVQRETESVIGLFLNLLALRTQLNGALSYRELLQRVRDTVLGAYMHQDVPFEKLVEELHPERHLSYEPIIQVMLVLQNIPVTYTDAPDLSMDFFGAESGTTKLDLTFAFRETPQGLNGLVEYATDLFEEATIARLVRHLQTLLEGCVANIHCPLAELPLLSKGEYQQQVIGWNETQADYPRDRFIHELFTEQAQRTPDAIAVTLQDEHLTYRQLDEQSTRLAHVLRRAGVAAETCVGLCLERSPALVIGLLAILKAGGAYLPLDPLLPPDRLQLLYSETRAPVLVMQASLLQRFTAFSGQVVCLDRDWDLIASQPCIPLPTSRATTHLAYVIYTSGSTGTPKGTLVTHHGLVNLALTLIDRLAVDAESRVLQFASISFDAAVPEFFTALLAGGTLVLLPEDILLDGPGLTHLLATQAITEMLLPPSLLAVLPDTSLPSLRTLIAVGEACSAALVRRWLSEPGRRFLNGYGPTEVTVGASSAVCSVDDEQPPIGTPFDNVQVYVLDDQLQPVPVGVAGEIYVAGPGLARGYLRRPDLTAERFLPNPFHVQSGGARMYRTGDMGRYRPDGVLEFVGRVDRQVKLRGFRIELGEIEAALVQHPSVRQAAACLCADQPGEPRLVAYVVPQQPDGIPDSSHLRTHLQERLPGYMVPAAILALPELPHLPNGKLDYSALPAPEVREEQQGAEPRTALEQTLVDIWADVLGRKQVGIYDNFFELGGDSIQIIQVSARAHQLGLRFTPAQLFQYQTPAELATVVNMAPPIIAGQGVVTGPVPLTAIQRWFFEQELPDPAHYNQSVLLEGPTGLEPALLEQALIHLLHHHDALRLRFTRTVQGWQAYNADLSAAGSLSLHCCDYAHLDWSEQRRAIEEVATTLHGSLTLEHGPLVQAAFFNLGARCCLLLIIHHLVVDTISWKIILEDLETVYLQLSRGERGRLPAKTTSWQQWSVRLREYVMSDQLRNEADYWLSAVSQGAGSLPLDFARSREENTEGSADSVTIALSAEETSLMLQELPRTHRTQINDLLLTALALTLREWSGRARVLVDAEGHGREQVIEGVDLSRTVGWFTTLFPLLLNLEGISQPGEALAAIKRQIQQVPIHGIGYGLLRYLYEQQELVTQFKVLPAAEVSLNYLGQSRRTSADNLLLRSMDGSTGANFSPLGQRRYLLEVVGHVAADQLYLTWIYSKQHHRQATIERLARRMSEMLRELIASCRTPLVEIATPSDFPLAQLTRQTLSKIAQFIEED